MPAYVVEEQWGCQPRSGAWTAGLLLFSAREHEVSDRNRQMNVLDTERGVTLLLAGVMIVKALCRRTWSTGEVAPAGGGQS